MVQLVLFHKKLINNTMVFSNSRNHLTLQIKKSLMTIRTCTILTNNQIQVLMLRLNLIPKQNRMETLSLMMPTMLTFPESHILSMLTTPQLLLDNLPTDGKETLSITPTPKLLVLREDQIKLRLLFKRKTIQTLLLEKLVTNTKPTTMLTSLVDQI